MSKWLTRRHSIGWPSLLVGLLWWQALVLPAAGGVIATGNLSGPDAVDVVLSFGLTIDSQVKVQTMSYAGGSVTYWMPTPGQELTHRTLQKHEFARGGFDPITAVRSGSNYLLVNDDGINAKVDAQTGVAFDSQIDGELAAGEAYAITISQYDNFPPAFNGGWVDLQQDGTFAPFTDVTGDLRTSEYGAVRVSLNDLVSNAITIDEAAVQGTTGTMLANYQVPLPPSASNLAQGLGFTLEEAASFGYFDHFNWYQTIDRLVGDFDRGTGIDPLLGGNHPFFDPADDYPWYWDEVDASTLLIDRSGYLLGSNTASDLQLFFQDTPNFNIPGYSAEFTTYLAGVKSDPNEGTVFGAGFENTSFRWRYTQTTESSGQVTIRNKDPLLGGGGTVEFLGFLTDDDWTAERIAGLNAAGVTVASQLPTANPVPEPATFASLVGILGLGAVSGWRRRRLPGGQQARDAA